MAVQLSIQIKNATLKRQGLEDLKRDIPAIGANRIYTALERVRVIMAKPGKRIHYPVNWDSSRQRAAFFATNGFGHGIPYTRTGKYNAGWIIRRNPSSYAESVGYTLANRSDHAKYVGGSADGTGQSWIHFDRWKLLRDEVDKAIGGLREDVQDHVALTARRRLG
jgi:hypothetical protein